MTDILFRTDSYVFSYRVAGVCIQNGKVLLQKPADDDGFAFPGGHAAFGETNAETLTREFKEEIGADIAVGGLKWVGEVFFDWGGKPCHKSACTTQSTFGTTARPQTAFSPRRNGSKGGIPRSNFTGFRWNASRKSGFTPPTPRVLLTQPDGGVEHFIYRE